MTETTPIARLQDARQLAASLRRLAEIKRANGLAYYKPHDKQDRFHRSTKPRRYCRTGNRWGKSTAGIAETLSWCMGFRPFYQENDPARYSGIPQRSVKGLLIVADWDKAEEIFTSQVEGEARGKIFKLLPEACFAGVSKNQSGNIQQIFIKSKWGGISTLYIDTVKSFKGNPMGNESSDWDFIHVDEPIPEEMWVANARGLIDREGHAWFCCTPITELWINDYFIPNGLGRKSFADGKTFEDLKDPEARIKFEDRWVITGTTYDNPYNTEKGIQAFKKDLSEADIQARLMGQPKQLSGVIYKEFDRELHIYSETPFGWKSPVLPPKDWTIRIAIDPHPRIPHAVLFAATGPLGHTYFFNELFAPCYIKDLCEAIKDALHVGTKDELEPFRNVCDPLAWTMDPTDGTTMADEFFACGVPIVAASKDLSRGILKVGSMLKLKDEKGVPLLRFHESLYTTLHEFERYVWDIKKEGPSPNCPDHMMECLYRLCIGGLDWVDMSKYANLHSTKPFEVGRLDLTPITYGEAVKKRKRVDSNTRFRN